MADTAHISRLLELNGVAAGASVEEVGTVLRTAGLTPAEIAVATELWNKSTLSQAAASAQGDLPPDNQLNVVTHSDRVLKPEAISSLLGVSVTVQYFDPKDRAREETLRSFLRLLLMLFFSSVVGIGFVLGALWYLRIGPFYGV